jgi:hypothetical protein
MSPEYCVSYLSLSTPTTCRSRVDLLSRTVPDLSRMVSPPSKNPRSSFSRSRTWVYVRSVSAGSWWPNTRETHMIERPPSIASVALFPAPRQIIPRTEPLKHEDERNPPGDRHAICAIHRPAENPSRELSIESYLTGKTTRRSERP